METEKFEQLTLSESEDEITIKMFPRYKDVNEEILENMIHVHENFFQWKRVQGQSTLSNFFERHNAVTFVRSSRSRKVDGKPKSFKWKNSMPIDLSGLQSVHRILLIRDITQRLRLFDNVKDDGNKMLTGNGKTTINFKLGDTIFSLVLAPSPVHPGNALIKMQRTKGKPYAKSHADVEKFVCFGKLDAKDIELIVNSARRTGTQITDRDINICEEDEVKKIMAEEMNFFMLLYDFEVARRLQRPFSNKSRNFDSLPIGIGIAMIHRINKTKNENKEVSSGLEKWVFFSGLFKDDWESRKDAFHKIVDAFGGCKEPSEVGTGAEHINNMLLAEQFGSQE
ncbi:hypothetical protein GHT06_007682 [Daphnia sinensis]|uniref:Uncharacterized protein n=1 Tax=Daphnia sinensis TaxID=1820382 RepID=A0AAD5LKV5_9CRUS|nr:hypothetical protein GHT06_010117 [Daphnia sinensis]KAI9563945.1 hypothetical protein GHT06_007682 [Daphnia sinensis]